MPHPLESARLKIARAEEHFDQLKAEAESFIKSQPYVFTSHTNVETGEHEVRVSVLQDPPMRLALIAGDVAHCLRAALDHIVFQFAGLGPGVRGEKTAFPIFSNADDYRRRAPVYLKGVRPEHWTWFEQMQPYHTGPLGLLNLMRLDDRDKHRIIDPVAAAARVGRLTPIGSVVLGSKYPKPPLYLNDGTVVCWYSTDPGDPNVAVVFDLPEIDIQFAVDGGAPVAGSELGTLINTIRQFLSLFVGIYNEAVTADHEAPPEP